MTERQLHELRDQWDKAHNRWSQVCDAIVAMRKVADELSAECERLAELIAEHDDTEIVITEDDGEAT